VGIGTRAAGAAVVITILLSASSVSSALGQVSPFQRSASVSLSSSRAGARDVSLKLLLNYEMQCGYPGPGPITVNLPAAERVPARLALARVTVNGSAPASVAISGHTVRIGLVGPPQVMCDEIGPGTVTILFTSAAGFGNPAHAGRYTLSATRGSAGFSTTFAITAA
jgi:hypothetical protein